MDLFDDTHAISIPGNPADGQECLIYPGSIVGGDYRIKKLLGRGGMGYVFLAEHTIIQKEYALKLVADTELSLVARQRFQSEGRAIASLNHPNIVKVHNMGLDSDRNPFYVMDLLDGQTLAEYKTKSIEFGDLIDLFIQVADGLSYAHRKDIIHRDIKPSNILIVTENNRPVAKIVDFGIAKVQSANPELQAFTKHGEILGSPLYMSPEQASGEAVDARTDIYSLGCTLFESLTGSAPFKGTTAVNTLLMHQSDPVPDLKSFCEKQRLPLDLNIIIGKMLAKKREKRYQNMEQLIHDLKRIKSGLPVGLKKTEYPVAAQNESESQTTTLIPQPSLMLTVIQIAAGIVVIVAAMAAITFGWQKSQPAKIIETTKKEDAVTELLKEQQTAGQNVETYANSIFENTDSIFVKKDKKAFRLAKDAYSNIKSINAQQLVIAGKKIKRIVFPEWPIGTVLALGKPPVEACGSKDFSLSSKLLLECGAEKSRQLFNFPEVLNKIDHDMFYGFSVAGTGFSIESVASRESLLIEDQGLISMLKTLQNWSNLKHLSITQAIISDKALALISSLPNIESLQFEKCALDTKKLEHAKFLKKLKRLQLQSISTAHPLISGVAHSNNLQMLHLYRCELTAEDLHAISDCPNLQTLEISDQSLPTLVPTIALLPQLRILRIGHSALSIEQIQQLTQQKNLETLQLNKESYDNTAIEKIQKLEPKVVFYKSEP